MTDHYDADVAATALLARGGRRMNEQLYGGNEEGSSMTDTPEIIVVDEALLAELDALAEMCIVADAAWCAAGKPPSGPERVAVYDDVTAYAKAVRNPFVVRALVEELRSLRVDAERYRDWEMRIIVADDDGRSAVHDVLQKIWAEAFTNNIERTTREREVSA